MKILKNKSIFEIILIITFFGLAIVGLVFSVVFVAMRLHLTDVKGSIDARNEYFKEIQDTTAKISTIDKTENELNIRRVNAEVECKIITVLSDFPINGQKILDTYIKTKDQTLVLKMVDALVSVTAYDNSLKDKIDRCTFMAKNNLSKNDSLSNQDIFNWISSSEWITLRDALIKDKDNILEASRVSGVPARTIVATVISEQFRFFTANRESYKKFFEPLKILGNGTKFSYGVAGVKFETARMIENNLKDKNSPYYLGYAYENVLDYTDQNTDAVLMDRLTNKDNHYYSYLYTGLFLKQIMNQWKNASYPIGDRPEVLSTLFNLGFNKSTPKENPDIGGSTITINGRDYTFGGLSYEFYYSGELSEIFPFAVQ